jgi:hypothetical protein
MESAEGGMSFMVMALLVILAAVVLGMMFMSRAKKEQTAESD